MTWAGHLDNEAIRLKFFHRCGQSAAHILFVDHHEKAGTAWEVGRNERLVASELVSAAGLGGAVVTVNVRCVEHFLDRLIVVVFDHLKQLAGSSFHLVAAVASRPHANPG